VVLHTNGNVITWLQAGRTQNIAEANRRLMQFQKRGDFPRLGVNDRWSLRVGGGCYSWVHASKLIQ
jgi:hypothetical protein